MNVDQKLSSMWWIEHTDSSTKCSFGSVRSPRKGHPTPHTQHPTPHTQHPTQTWSTSQRDSSAAGRRLTQWSVSVWLPCLRPAGSALSCLALEVRKGRWRRTPGGLQRQTRSLHNTERKAKWDILIIKKNHFSCKLPSNLTFVEPIEDRQSFSLGALR